MHARSLQESGNDPGKDNYVNINLKKGDVIYGLTPGQSSFYTTLSSIKNSDFSKVKLNQGLQIAAHPKLDYRKMVTAYEVLEDTQVAFSKV